MTKFTEELAEELFKLRKKYNPLIYQWTGGGMCLLVNRKRTARGERRLIALREKVAASDVGDREALLMEIDEELRWYFNTTRHGKQLAAWVNWRLQGSQGYTPILPY